MNKLIVALERLYFLPDALPAQDEITQCLTGDGVAAFQLLAEDGGVRTLQLHFARSRDWPFVASLYQGVIEELELPAPVISTSGEQGFILWLSLQQAVPLEKARNFLHGLYAKYLADIPERHVTLQPSPEMPALATLTPSMHPVTGRWSAFIDPSLGSMFTEESGLEIAPNMDRQADLLSSLNSISPLDFERVLRDLPKKLASTPEKSLQPVSATMDASSSPEEFLLSIMRDELVSLKHRIKAAKALLPQVGKS